MLSKKSTQGLCLRNLRHQQSPHFLSYICALLVQHLPPVHQTCWEEKNKGAQDTDSHPRSSSGNRLWGLASQPPRATTSSIRNMCIRLCDKLEGGTYVYLWWIHADVWWKSTGHCKVTITQLKINFRKGNVHWTLLKSFFSTSEIIC